MNPLLIGPLMDLAGKVFDRVLPDDEAKEKAKAEFLVQASRMEQAEVDSFRDFVVKYEGQGDKVHPALQILRGSVRPVLTYFLAGAFVWGFINPGSINDDTMNMLFNLNLLSMGFWYGERALKNLNLDLGKKNG